MGSVTKFFCVVYLSLCVFFQGLAVYAVVPEQSGAQQQANSPNKTAVVVSLGAPLANSNICCDHHPTPYDEQAEKENVPVMWEIDSHGPSSHPPYLPLGSLQVASSENNNYPTPVYTLHRPPDVLS
ncbi:MAG TPA: hypothetical protein VEA39_04245 [Methylophilaceae bacterium]|nr:hypothetical protein [Methylophilaceae bacterium]